MKRDRKKFNKSFKKQTEQKSELDSFEDKGGKNLVTFVILVFFVFFFAFNYFFFFSTSCQYDIYEDINLHALPFKNIDALITVKNVFP